MAGVKLRLCKVSFKGIEAREPDAFNRILSSLGSEVVEILPSESRSFDVKVWLRDPGTVPMVYKFEIIRNHVKDGSQQSFGHQVIIVVVDETSEPSASIRERRTKYAEQFKPAHIESTNGQM